MPSARGLPQRSRVQKPGGELDPGPGILRLFHRSSLGLVPPVVSARENRAVPHQPRQAVAIGFWMRLHHLPCSPGLVLVGMRSSRSWEALGDGTCFGLGFGLNCNRAGLAAEAQNGGQWRGARQLSLDGSCRNKRPRPELFWRKQLCCG